MPAKVLLVEDDNNLREIYQARLMAEGYTIVTARDGEEALGVAKAEMPDLIISDVMMPRVSGFEMLDILRNTEGLKDTKVIMLTALGQADDKTRANSLGADRYLVKSQVTLEDIVKTSHELLEGTAATAAAPPAANPVTNEPTAAPMPVAPAPDAAVPAPQPGAPAETPAMAVPPVSQPVASPVGEAPATPVQPPAPTAAAPSTAEEQAAIGAQIEQFMNAGPTTPTAAATTQDDAVLATAVQDLAASSAATDTTQASSTSAVDTPATPAVTAAPAVEPAGPPATPQNDTVTIANKKVIQPLSSDAPKAPIHEILAREEAAGMHGEMAMPPAPATTFSPTTPGSGSAMPMGAVVSMPEAPAASPATPPNPADPNNIAL